MSRSGSALAIVVVLVLPFLLATRPASSQRLLFADGFESGDTTAWSSVVGLVDCLSGTAPADLLAGDLGPAPSGTLVACLEMRDDRSVARSEIAFSSLPLPRGLGLVDGSELVLVAPGSRRVASQLDVVSRWAAPLVDASAPIRWLQVATPVTVAAGGTTRYELRRVPGDTPPPDPFAVDVAEAGAQVTIDTGLATFTLDSTNPALFSSIAIDLDDDGQGRVPIDIQTPGGTPGAGPRLVFAGAGGDVALDTSVPGAVTVDEFEIVERGPVKAVVAMRGHFVDAGGESLCSTLGGTVVYERFGWTVVATFERASRDVGLELHVRNECSAAASGPWTDEAVTLRSFTWSLPFALGSPRVAWAGAGAPQVEATAGSARVVQERGDESGGGWTRRASVEVDGGVVETGEAFERPWVAVVGTPASTAEPLAGIDVTVSAQMGWMRFREPAALGAAGSTLSLEPVSTTLVVGEGKGIWSRARVDVTPTGSASDVGLEARRTATAHRLERGLVPWPGRAAIDAAQVFPGLGDDQPSTLRTHYVAWMERMHDEMVGTAWWHRSSFGSDDHTYNMSLELGYALRPTPSLRTRLGQAGAAMDRRYDIPRADESTRECFLNQVDLTRQVIQHFEMIANCAEFVPGAVGQSCHDKLMELLDELAQDNLDAGLLCQRFEASCLGNPPPPATLCSTPQFFMDHALIYPFFHRAWRNYGDPPNGSIRTMLVEWPRRLYLDAMPKLANGTAIDPGVGVACDASDGSGCWWPRMECTLSADQTTVLGCQAAQDSDQLFAMASHTRPHTVAMLLMAHEIDPTVGLCGVAREVYDIDAFTGDPDDAQGNWNGVGHFLPIGWWKGTSQMMQSMVWAVGIADGCS